MKQEGQVPGAVIAVAGRRVDAEGTDPPRFPLANVPLVRKRLAKLFLAKNAAVIVCSAACGADLIALEEAERLDLRRRVVLPFPPERFRETSVIDRPGDWVAVFDRIVAAARSAGDLVVVGDAEAGDTAYAAANEAIICQAKRLAEADGTHQRLAVVVWEGEQRAGVDATASFRELATKAGFEQRSVLTL